MATPSEARACAHVVLRRFQHGAYVDRAFHSAAAGLGARDRSLAMRISFGAVQRAGTLDHLIERIASRPTGRLDDAVLAALRAGLYELLYMHGAPDRAVVDDTVELVKQGSSRGGGLVNAVLRRAGRERQQLIEDFEESTPESAAIAHSHPLWLARMWWQQLGGERARTLMAAGNEPAEPSLRVNTLVSEPAAVAAQLPVRRGGSLLGVPLPEALALEEPFDLSSSALWREGAMIAQSRAAMLASIALDPQPGQRVLDLCAAPGGKSTHLAALMGGDGRVLAVEGNAKRAGALRATVARMRASIVTVVHRDALALTGAERFHRVLLDAPCSGLGTLQAHPDLRWRMTPERIATLTELQAALLHAAAARVDAGGLLVYSTCTISRSENEHQIDSFLQSHPDFRVEPPSGVQPTVDGRFLLTLPDRDRTAGFFIARMRRE